MSNSIARLLDFLNDLSNRKTFYRLSHNRKETIMVEVQVPGERWEVEFFEDGSIEVERFLSDGTIHDESVLRKLQERFSD